MSRRSSIGFDRKIQLEWLDATAAKIEEGSSGAELRDFLFNYLSHLSGERKNGGARYKTVAVLSRVWSQVPPEAEPLRTRALELLRNIEPADRLALHWAMTIAAYPFFSDVAATIGRILGLQDSVAIGHVERRILELWGERSTVKRTCQYVMRSMVDWGVLEDAGIGVYRRSGVRRVVNGEVGALLLEAVLLDTEKESVSLDHARNHPSLFPFEVQVNSNGLRQSERLRVFRQGLDTDFVALAV